MYQIKNYKSYLTGLHNRNDTHLQKMNVHIAWFWPGVETTAAAAADDDDDDDDDGIDKCSVFFI